jgi:hypothetical protein
MMKTLTANSETVTRLADRLNGGSLRTVIVADQGSKFRSYSVRNMNQWFRPKGGNLCDKMVQTFNL